MTAQADTMQPGQPTERPRILVVECQPTMRQVFMQFLTEEGYEVVGASNGCMALSLLDDVRPDLILLDLNAPVIDDFAFLVDYQQTPEPHVPIVLVSVFEPLARRGIELGAVDYLLKPINLDALSDLVQTYLA